MWREPLRKPLILASLIALSGAMVLPDNAQSLDKSGRERGRRMLDRIKEDVRKNYYDPAFRGIDLDAHFKAAGDKMEQADSSGQATSIIAQSLLDLDDQHTWIIPVFVKTFHYGWRMQIIGDKCYVVSVIPDSDAAAKGLKPGDEVHSIDGFWPVRENIWKLDYLYRILGWKPEMQVVLRQADGRQRTLNISGRVISNVGVGQFSITTAGDFPDINWLVRQAELELMMEANARSRFSRDRWAEVGNLVVWKVPDIGLIADKVNSLIDKTAKGKSLILDLRGSAGEGENGLMRLAGGLFDRDIRVADIAGRNGTKSLTAKTRGDRAFKGDLYVLVDSETRALAEVFARLVQIEKRGIVIGDRTAGRAMKTKIVEQAQGSAWLFPFLLRIAAAKVIMPDGKSIEKAGIMPDEVLLPTVADMASGFDSVLSHAATMAGEKLTPEEAGALFKTRQKK